MNSKIRSGLICAALALPSLSWAHVGADAGQHHGLAEGLLHPLTGVDHLVAMVAVGVWSALTARSAQWTAPLGFVAMLLLGACLAAAGLSLPAVEPMIAVSVLVMGLLVAARRVVPGTAGLALVGTFALFHGAAHGAELSGAAALAGMVLTTVALQAAGLGLGTLMRRGHRGLSTLAGLGSAAWGLSLLWA
ncbi:HupE/UreJ family protein [Ideonella livida]|uniref:HupE/UreJ family protein n=1 Tax=Ideonella livida TaxID=2707176 RepID=A0A7C9TJ89_9BURK|nr:HupE/UreJ family protein [Ideonella livida]NDY90067.1 HupE/UreJ family protein [Ideonella livida]